MESKKTKMQSFWEIVRFTIIALIIVIPIRLFIAEPFIVSGDSMVPTFNNGNYLIVDKLSYEMGNPQRDDIIIFKYPIDPSKYFIKRIIGLPNETVDIQGNTITITNAAHPEGFTLTQPFIINPADNDTHITLTKDQYFVMGDNRRFSSDSRAWGPVNRNLIVGKVFLRLWPVNKIDVLPGNYKQS